MVNSHKNKTVVDAVNELMADILNIQNYNQTLKNIRFNGDDEDEYLGFFLSNFDKQRFSILVCTVEEFNQCVAEMSEGLFVPDCRPKQHEIQYDKDGNGWEVGAIYEFSDNLVRWFSGTFCEYSPSYERKYVDDTKSHWEFIRECQLPIGKIHKKPIELVDGAAYQFEYIAGKFIGIYGKSDDLFYMSNNRTLNREHTKNIIKLVPESV